MSRLWPVSCPPLLKPRGPHRANPSDDLARIFWVHVKEMAHRRSHKFHVGLVEFHPNFAVKNFKHRALPILNDIVMGGKARVDEGAQVLADRLASVPISHPQVADSVLGKAIEAFAECLVINLFPHRQEPSRGRGLCEGYRVHIIYSPYFSCILPHRWQSALSPTATAPPTAGGRSA